MRKISINTKRIAKVLRILVLYYYIKNIAICPLLHHKRRRTKKAFTSKVWNVLKIQFEKFDIKVLNQWCVNFHIQHARSYKYVLKVCSKKDMAFHFFSIKVLYQILYRNECQKSISQMIFVRENKINQSFKEVIDRKNLAKIFLLYLPIFCLLCVIQWLIFESSIINRRQQGICYSIMFIS